MIMSNCLLVVCVSWKHKVGDGDQITFEFQGTLEWQMKALKC